MRTQVKSKQVLDQGITRDDINTTTTGQALITKLILGDGLTAQQTGIDPGTGDVTLNLGYRLVEHATDPTVTDDISQGFTSNSTWINTVTKNQWVCVDSSSGAAVWKKTTELDDMLALAIALG